MNLRQLALNGAVAVSLSVAGASWAGAQGVERFTATATVKAAGGAAATAPLTISISRKMSQAEVDALTKAFATGGVSALRKALVNVPATGSIQLGAGKATPTRLTLERVTPNGRLLTMVADQPILWLGAGTPDAKPKEGYDFAIVDIEVGADGRGSGSFAGAAKVTVKQGAFVVDDYASEMVKLVDVKKLP